MTSEICLMNSLSVVLAADSATTVEYYGENGPERRYFKGANKIFQLSDRHPVGLMIYQSASLMSVPWEVSIKEFRRELDEKSFNSVRGFSEEFTSFIQDNQRFFPIEVRRKVFCQAVTMTCLRWVIPIANTEDENRPSNEEIISEFLSGDLDLSISSLSEDEIEDLWNSVKVDIVEGINFLTHFLGEINGNDKELIARRTFELQLLSYENDDNYTGLVFAGFGDHSVFPELISYGKCRFIGTKFVVEECQAMDVSHDVPAVMSGFAQTSMTDTFSLGLSFEVFAKMQTIFAEELKLLVDQLGGSQGQAPTEATLAILKERLDSSKRKLFKYTESEHSLPLRRVLGFLPVDEMAELAETLINLQSLKEKVTKPSETVGGPVDVAAITRAEGLVWIKRKHYFEPEINSRYFNRRGH